MQVATELQLTDKENDARTTLLTQYFNNGTLRKVATVLFEPVRKESCELVRWMEKP
jgi:hypothetical protein